MRRGSAAYRIADEPTPGTLAGLVVNPFWILLAGMLGGAWLALPWFAFNGIAMGSATKSREQMVIAGCVTALAAASLLLWRVLAPQVDAGAIDIMVFRFALIGFQILKLGSYYWLHALQTPSFAIHEYYSGTVKNGVIVLIAGAVLRSRVLGAFDGSPMLTVLLA